MSEVQRLMTAKEVAEVLGTARETVYRMVSDGRLPVVKFGHRSTRFRSTDVNAFVDRNYRNGRISEVD